jgi:hypothetical protein
MVYCVNCKAEIKLSGDGVLICSSCSVREILTKEVLETTAKKIEAFGKFEAIMRHVPGGLPQPDGTQQIKNASNELATARKQMAQAYQRLSDYLDNGIVPEELQPPSKKAKAMAAGLYGKAAPVPSRIFLKR